ncbi:MAG: ABC transporter permease [Acidobacteriota bacterium]|nr:ABC transporter permease [Acidobacteriota bacterium]
MEKENYIVNPNPQTLPQTDDKAESSVVIKPSGSALDLEWREYWSYRELFYFLALRDIKVRYKQTALGIAWVLLQPIATTLIFAILFSRFASSDAFPVPFALFAFSGFVLWTFVNTAISYAANSLINHSGLITKVYFPRLIIPAAAVAACLLDLLVGLVSLAAAMIFYGIVPTWKIVFAPFFLLLILLLTLGVGILLSAINVKFRDVKQLLPFAIQFWLFISPVFYSLKLLPENLVWLWKLNPLSGALENFRAALFGLEFDIIGILLSVVITIVVLLAALYVFRRMEDDFADVI